METATRVSTLRATTDSYFYEYFRRDRLYHLTRRTVVVHAREEEEEQSRSPIPITDTANSMDHAYLSVM
jgi:hypothetical protein